MLLNDTTKDVKKLMVEESTNQTEIAKKLNTRNQYINRVINTTTNPISKPFMAILEAIGYDIKIEYIKRED
ncbi:MAG: XRE family transcriptional regulator [Anaerovoracaceae bacterium]